jgi:hypothetical protein
LGHHFAPLQLTALRYSNGHTMTMMMMALGMANAQWALGMANA